MVETQYRPEDPTANGFPHRPLSGDELLPPVEPPPAGFILQLFVIPALIVLVLLAVWQVPKWLVRRTSADPLQLIQRLEQGSSIARFQTAFDLANKLRDQRYTQFRRSPEAAKELGAVLDRQLNQAGGAGGMDDDELRFRSYLTRALGEFEVQEGMGALLKAAETNRDPREQVVRDGAVQAIAVRAHRLGQLDPPQQISHADLAATLARLAHDDDPLIRLQTAFALGQIGTPEAIERLEVMVGDPHADTRYNAAVALAVHGNAAAIPTLAEMLELEDLPSVREETTNPDRANKRAIIVSNAIQATRQLAEQNPAADFAPIITALEQLASADAEALAAARVPTGAISEVKRTLAQLKEARG